MKKYAFFLVVGYAILSFAPFSAFAATYTFTLTAGDVFTSNSAVPEGTYTFPFTGSVNQYNSPGETLTNGNCNGTLCTVYPTVNLNSADGVAFSSGGGPFQDVSVGGVLTWTSAGVTSGAVLIASTSTAPAILAAAESTVSDPGVLEIVGLVAGVYISFYVLRGLIGLMPRKRGGIYKGRQ